MIRYQKRKLMGLCTMCGDPNDTDGVLCSICTKINTINVMALYGRRKADNLCIRCGGQLDDNGKKTCSKCREKRRVKHLNNWRSI